MANKVDSPHKVVNTEEGQQLAAKLGCEYFETSAKEKLNVTECFDSMSQSMLEIVETDESISDKFCISPVCDSTKYLKPKKRWCAWLRF